jgi:hypothetical protein
MGETNTGKVLTELTMDIYKGLAERGAVEQVSKPFVIGLLRGSDDTLAVEVRRHAERHPDANAYVTGRPYPNIMGLIIPVVLYNVDQTAL